MSQKDSRPHNAQHSIFTIRAETASNFQTAAMPVAKFDKSFFLDKIASLL
jgi:hypothetical protein